LTAVAAAAAAAEQVAERPGRGADQRWADDGRCERVSGPHWTPGQDTRHSSGAPPGSARPGPAYWAFRAARPVHRCALGAGQWDGRDAGSGRRRAGRGGAPRRPPVRPSKWSPRAAANYARLYDYRQ